MGTYIKHFKKPDNCEMCPCCRVSKSGVLTAYVCKITGHKMITDEPDSKQIIDCPMKNIETPHGRIVDIDKAYDWVKYTTSGMVGAMMLSGLKMVMDDTPVIIEAEEE